jgi:hypothetical protein
MKKQERQAPIIKKTKRDAPNLLTIKTIKKAHRGIGLGKPVKNISDFVRIQST